MGEAPVVGSATERAPAIARVAMYIGHGRVVVGPAPGQPVCLVTLDRADPTLFTEVVRLTSP